MGPTERPGLAQGADRLAGLAETRLGEGRHRAAAERQQDLDNPTAATTRAANMDELLIENLAGREARTAALKVWGGK